MKDKINRRDFLKRAAGSAAALSMTGMLLKAWKKEQARLLGNNELRSSYLITQEGEMQEYWQSAEADRILEEAGYLICDGRELNRGKFSALYKVIGTKFGGSPSHKTFNLPDMRVKFLRTTKG